MLLTNLFLKSKIDSIKENRRGERFAKNILQILKQMNFKKLENLKKDHGLI